MRKIGFKRVQRVQKVQRGWWRLTPQIKIKKEHGFAAGCVEGLYSLRSGDAGKRFKGCGSGYAAVFSRRLAVSSA